ncbi:Importin subunit alpha-2 [Hibiscus syriacus]|uniref:Importin subunit alpha-2 n=1 Tax=Hibiscus syriacus TaxID=106335 RepID=A0A6A2YA42_HIBSY|nr:Importin subunit alpha-2 [Hibiscus syriacus]
MSFRPNAKTEVRRNRYKVAVDAEEGRRRREDNMVEIRKNRCEESLQKKRREGLQAQPMPASLHSSAVVKKLEYLPAMVAGVWSDDNNLQLEATTQFRKLLSIEHSPPIEEVIQAGVVPRFVEFLLREDFPQLQFEAAWALTNIASGTSENTKVVIDHGAIPIFVKLLGSPSDDVREQAVWALGNVASDSPRCRDLVLSHGALLPLLALLNEHAKLSMLRNATWTLSNFCRGKPQPPFDQVKPALPALAHLIHSNDDEAVIEANIIVPLVHLLQNAEFDIKKEAAWAISNATSGGTPEQINQGCIKPLCDLLNCHDPRIVTVCLEGLENILKVGEADKNLGSTGGVNLYAQMIDDAEGLENIENLLSHDNTEIYEKAVKILETYWLEEEEDMKPQGDASQTGFQFGGDLPVPSGGFNVS